jgi:hypothetical protein
MGTCCSCFKEEKEYHNTLISDKYCFQCQTTFISNIEYNRHIPTCCKINGDI